MADMINILIFWNITQSNGILLITHCHALQLVIVVLIAGKPPVKLTPLELAVGEELTKSRKRRRELIDMSYHRSVYLPGTYKLL